MRRALMVDKERALRLTKRVHERLQRTLSWNWTVVLRRVVLIGLVYLCAQVRPMFNAQCPMPNAQCPTPNAQCPAPNAQCPMPNAQCPVPNAQCPSFQLCSFARRSS